MDTGYFKRSSTESWSNYSPTTSQPTSVDTYITFQIPQTNVIFDMSRGMIHCDLMIPIRITGDDASELKGGEKLIADEDERILGLLDAGTLFDIVQIQIGGITVYHETFNQTQCRLRSLNTSDDWCLAQPQTYFNPVTTKITETNQLTCKKIQLPTSFSPNDTTYVTKHLTIPLPSIFPCFENMNVWPSFCVNDTLILTLSISQLDKYMVLFKEEDQASTGIYNSVYTIEAGTDYSCGYSCRNLNPESMGNTPSLDLLVSFDFKNAVIDKATIHVPYHSPEGKEISEIKTLIDYGGGIPYGFKRYEIVSQMVDFDTSSGVNKTVTFNTNSNNISEVIILALHDNNQVVFDKPLINAIQLNLGGGTWQLAYGCSHTENNYSFGTDMYYALLDGWGQNAMKNLQTVNSQVVYSESIPIESTEMDDTFKPVGGYLMYFNSSPYDEVGIGSSNFANIINFKFNLGVADGEEMTAVGLASNYANSNCYACIQTFSVFHVNASRSIIENPFGDSLDVDKIVSKYNTQHGIITEIASLLPTAIGWIGKGINALSSRIKSNRVKRYMNKAKTALGDKAFNENYDKLKSASTSSLRVRNKTLKDLKKQVRNAKHGTYCDNNVPFIQNTTPDGFEKKINSLGDATHGAMIVRHGMMIPRHGAMIPRHGTMKAFTKYSMKPFIPGWKGKLNTKPLRLNSFTRFSVVPIQGSFNAMHGLASPYHGFRDSLSQIAGSLLSKLPGAIVSRVPDAINTFKSGNKEQMKQFGKQIGKDLLATGAGTVIAGMQDGGWIKEGVNSLKNKISNKIRNKGTKRSHGISKYGSMLMKMPGGNIDILSLVNKGPHLSKTRKLYSLRKPYGAIVPHNMHPVSKTVEFNNDKMKRKMMKMLGEGISMKKEPK